MGKKPVPMPEIENCILGTSALICTDLRKPAGHQDYEVTYTDAIRQNYTARNHSDEIFLDQQWQEQCYGKPKLGGALNEQ